MDWLAILFAVGLPAAFILAAAFLVD